MGILSGLQSDPRGTLIMLLYMIPAILISLTLHELSHGYVAYRCGDPTAQMLGRLSFNPLKHLDPIGTLFMVLFGFGWARPVPVNSRNFKHFRRDELLVSLAGVTMNFCLFIVSMLLITLVNELMWKPEFWALDDFLDRRTLLNFDSVGLYLSMTMDTSLMELFGTFMKTPWLTYVQCFLMLFARINLSLCIFNLLPIPPLDGYHVVNDIFLRGKLHIPSNVLSILMVGLLIFMYSTDYISDFLYNAVTFVQSGVLSAIMAVFGLG